VRGTDASAPPTMSATMRRDPGQRDDHQPGVVRAPRGQIWAGGQHGVQQRVHQGLPVIGSSSRCRTISAASPSGAPPMSTVMDRSSGPGGSRSANWESSNPVGMKWPCRTASRAAICSRVPRQVDEHHPLATQHVPVAPFERGAGDDARSAVGGACCDPARHPLQPGPPVSVLQGMPGRHLLHVGPRVHVVALGQVPAQPPGEDPGHRRLPAARHSHEHQDRPAQGLVHRTSSHAP